MCYRETLIGQWSRKCWFAFFRFLATRLERSTVPGWELGIWDRDEDIPNRETKWTFFWYRRACTDNPTNIVYLDIQVKPERPDAYLNFRIQDTLDRRNENREQVLTRWSGIREDYGDMIIAEAARMNIPDGEITKPDDPSLPKRFNGEGTMCFAVVEREKWLGKDNDIVNENEVVKKLHIYENVLERCFVGN